MFCFYRLVTCIITLAVLSVVYGQKYQLCVVDGKGGFKLSEHYCPQLDKPNTNVECVLGLDRLDCLRRISKGKVDFAVFTPEDLVTAHNSEIEILITHELRYTEDKYDYEVVAVIRKDAGIRSRHDLRDKKLCHPGYGYEDDWTRILANFLEASVVPQLCNPQLTITENRIKATSDFFKAACKAGPWVNNPVLDDQLKRKYPNLCSLCDSARCSTDDKYWGRRGPLFCLTDGAGDISWVRFDDVQSHFGLTPGTQEESPNNYQLLCPNDSVMPLNSTNPCVWVVKPWPVIATKRASAENIQQILSNVSNLATKDPYQYALLNLIQASSKTLEKIQPVQAIGSYLDTAKGFLSANSFSGCHPPRTIKICTTSIIENAKCAWMRESAAAYGIEPDIDCIKADNTTHCMMALNSNNAADVVVVPPDLTSLAKREYGLKTLFYETVQDAEKYITVALTKPSSGLSKFEDLAGKKACFPVHNGIAWNTALHVLHKKNLLSCPIEKNIGSFFGPSCVPGLSDGESGSLKEICEKNFNGEFGAIRCLNSGKGDVAFVSKNSLRKFLADNIENPNGALKATDFKILCENPSEPCHLSWSPVGYGMVRGNSENLWMKDTLDVFLQLDNLFGKNYKSTTTPYTMFGMYDGKSNLLFQDVTLRLREKPTTKNIDTMVYEYEDILRSDTKCIQSGSSGSNALFVILNLGLFYTLLLINVIFVIIS